MKKALLTTLLAISISATFATTKAPAPPPPPPPYHWWEIILIW